MNLDDEKKKHENFKNWMWIIVGCLMTCLLILKALRSDWF